MSSKNTLLSRRNLLGFGWAALIGAGSSKLALAHDLTSADPQFPSDKFETTIRRPGLTIKQVHEWSNIHNNVWGNVVNSLNAYQFSYNIPPQHAQVAVQAYGTANAALYDDVLWKKYEIGSLLGVKDSNGQPAKSNPYYLSPVSPKDIPDGTKPIKRNLDHTAVDFFNDESIEGLQRRNVIFLVCHNQVHADARFLANLTKGDQATIAAEIQSHLLPGVIVAPSGVGSLVRFQNLGYRLVVNN